MTSHQPTYLVFGATGKQGGATVSALLTKLPASSICILTRNPSSAAAQRLASKGVQVFKGDMSDILSLISALGNVTALHLVTDYTRGADVEISEAKNVITAARKCGVHHIVFSSVDGEGAGVPHWESKFQIEKMVKETDMNWTILRPSMFMDNFPVDPGMGRTAMLGVFDSGAGGNKMSVVATEDIGWFAAEAMTNPQEYGRRVVNLAGDCLTVTEMTKVYKTVQGDKACKIWIPQTLLYGVLPADMAAMMKFMRDHKSSPDINGLREQHPGLLNFEGWLRLRTAGSDDVGQTPPEKSEQLS
ncbi:hypothetical protein DL96DRAFT_1472428 [Flagelloscypha sp. PMI_526]|nr:hypothetical protein DL96DRAFT_1472428 [Flagelloscypha sp. PMI_526]